MGEGVWGGKETSFTYALLVPLFIISFPFPSWSLSESLWRGLRWMVDILYEACINLLLFTFIFLHVNLGFGKLKGSLLEGGFLQTDLQVDHTRVANDVELWGEETLKLHRTCFGEIPSPDGSAVPTAGAYGIEEECT
jgi:hypothetical protein